MQSQVRFNRVAKKVPDKVLGGFGAELGQVQQGSGEGSGECSGGGSGRLPGQALVQSQVRFNRICGHLIHGNPAEVFPAPGFAARFRKNCKNKRCGCWGYHRSLFLLREIYGCSLSNGDGQGRFCLPLWRLLL